MIGTDFKDEPLDPEEMLEIAHRVQRAECIEQSIRMIQDGIRILSESINLDECHSKLMVAAGKSPRKLLITFLSRLSEISGREIDKILSDESDIN